MKIKSILISAIVSVFLVLINSCSKDDSAPKQQIAFGGHTISLNDANLYLISNSNCCGVDYRDYFISDGVHTGGSGWDIDNYTDATYYIGVQIAVPEGSDYVAGNFPVYYDFNDVPDNSNGSYIYFESGLDGNDYFTFESPDGSDHDPIVVSGGFDDGEQMTLKFSGTLAMYHYDNGNWVTTEVTGKFLVKGTIDDRRPI